jgi:hypothetical protein
MSYQPGQYGKSLTLRGTKYMKRNLGWLTAAIVIGGALVAVNSAMADVTIDNFHNFTANALYAS